MDPILSTIDEALKRKGLSDAAASKLAVGHPSLIKNLRMERAGEKRYNLPALQRLSEVLGLEFYFGPPRGADPEPPVLDIDGDDFAAIPRLAVEASAGTGALNDDTPEIVGKLAFRRDWLRKIGVKPDRAMLITVTGDSMAPDLRPGDLALIDQDRNAWEHNRVVALVDLDGGLRIKRVLLDPGRAMVLASDNPAHLPELRTKHEAARLTCLGRVVWSGRHWE